MISRATSGRRRALSIQQPYAEAILVSKKRIEYRSRPTTIRGRVHIYAALTPNDEGAYHRFGLPYASLPVGVLVGSVEIVGCSRKPDHHGNYHWKLANPRRLRRPLKPTHQAQPAWFYPF